MEYSNYGFILLGRIIEIVSGESYQTYVRKHIYEPAGMLHTESRQESDNVAGRAVGYSQGQADWSRIPINCLGPERLLAAVTPP
jgi:D-alanyl-D-alanine carboxypeptidase